MKLYILGETRDDKGAQLEELTRTILERQGYKNIQSNLQVGGGSEIDAYATKESTTGVKNIETHVLCECKAHERPIDMNDWLKFIGKVTIERKNNPGTIGIMLALSGANGAVVGSRNTDFKDDDTIQLIANDDLITLLTNIYHLPSVEEAKEKVSKFPFGQIAELSLVYYHLNVWWLAGFSNNAYTLCDNVVNPLPSDAVKEIINLFPKYTTYQSSSFVDVHKTIEYIRLTNLIESTALLAIITNDKMTMDDLQSSIHDDSATGKSVSMEMLQQAIRQNPVFNVEDNVVSLKPDERIDFIDFYRRIMSNGVPIELLMTDYYQTHINDKLLDRIKTINEGFEIPDKIHRSVIEILRMSPSALTYVIVPDRLLKGYHLFASKDPQMEAMYQDYFIGRLIKCFKKDLENQYLTVLFSTLKMDKLSFSETVSIKRNGDADVQLSSTIDYALANVQGGQPVLIILKKENQSTDITKQPKQDDQ